MLHTENNENGDSRFLFKNNARKQRVEQIIKELGVRG